ncbi:MAG: TldD/PmbA family protein [Anaerosomatales bacterium]|nr:TldD/PmbA family protein [Anaerosomatales bacterium]MDI6842949.1 TldD/PmbA family protein [Anaerosomatales bacterium]GAV31796.1 predicted Zn-dependent proteases and their inactivated homologs [Coriobacteriaceae bacterium EMTCatB1]
MSMHETAAEIAERTLALARGDEVEVLASVERSALTRFANNRIHQNVAERSAGVSVRVVVGTRQGCAATDRVDEESLERCCERAREAALRAPEDPSFPGLPEPSEAAAAPARPLPDPDAFGPDARAEAAAAIIAQSAERGLTAAGTVSVRAAGIAVANSRGVRLAATTGAARATVLSMHASGASGWASWLGTDPAELAADSLGDRAALLAERSVGAEPLEPGSYPVVLAPDAVADLLDFLGYTSFGARAYFERSSFVALHEGERLFPETLTIVDDALSPEAVGLPFDFEGVPKHRVALVERGVPAGVVTDSYWAAKLARTNTGHALPAPNPWGPMPLDLAIEPGDATVDEMIAAVERGVYVTRFHYVNVEDPATVLLTGMTRDGTFLIEDGRLSRPLANARFTQSVVEALKGLQAIGRTRELVGTEDGGACLAPALALASWQFTGQTG